MKINDKEIKVCNKEENNDCSIDEFLMMLKKNIILDEN